MIIMIIIIGMILITNNVRSEVALNHGRKH